ncbi:MAG: hypothetical protein ABIN80_20380 [Dyadobacter sp.]|uniref:hypothetical protein n=1 Tax=Dyadobacter sp. TaxID=1914288 RepID=UPI0032673903
MYTAVKGIYENGVLTFVETPPAIKKSEVVVLFMDEGKQANATLKSKGVVLGSLVDKGYHIPNNFS